MTKGPLLKKRAEMISLAYVLKTDIAIARIDRRSVLAKHRTTALNIRIYSYAICFKFGTAALAPYREVIGIENIIRLNCITLDINRTI